MRDCANKLSTLGANPTSSAEATVPSTKAGNLSAERHYTVEETAEMWNLSTDAVRKIFRNVPGVLVLGANNPKRGKRRYETLRIPQSVLERVHSQYSLGNSVPTR